MGLTVQSVIYLTVVLHAPMPYLELTLSVRPQST